MERSFIMPIAISAGLHVAVLFGVRWPHAILDRSGTAGTSVRLEDSVQIIEPPVPDVTESVDAAKASGGPSVPDLPDPPPVATKDPFVQPKIDRVPRIPTDAPRVDILPRGPGDGDPFDHSVGTRIFAGGELDNTPRARLQIAPQYPSEARGRGIDGEVMVEFIVDESGSVQAPHVVNSSDRIFEEAALRAVAKWRFEPGRRGGQVVRFRMVVPIVFKLSEN